MSVDFSAMIVYGHKFGELELVDDEIMKIYDGGAERSYSFFDSHDVDDLIVFNGEDEDDWLIGFELARCDYEDGATKVTNLSRAIKEARIQLNDLYNQLDLSIEDDVDSLYLVQYCSY